MSNQHQPIELIEPTSIYGEEAIKDMIGKPPGWILRTGISVLFLVVLIGIALSLLIRYPDKIQAPVIITTEHPPIEVVALQSGKIKHLLIKDKEKVSVGTPIAYIENTTNPDDLQKFQQFIHAFEVGAEDHNYLDLDFPQQLELGIFQSDASAFEQQFEAYKFLLRQKSTAQQITALQSEKLRNQNLFQVMKRERSILEKELNFLEIDRQRYEELHLAKTVSDREYETKEMEVLQKKREIERIGRELINQEIHSESLGVKQWQLAEQRAKKLDDFKLALQELKQRINGKILDWERQYYLKASLSGICQLPAGFVENSNVTVGQVCAYIIPEGESGQILARAKVPVWGVGKIKVSDQAILRLDPYPYKEFGSIYGSVSAISILPATGREPGMESYAVTIPLGAQLTTSYEKEIPYRPNMTGTVQLITKDKSFFYRLFERLISIIKN